MPEMLLAGLAVLAGSVVQGALGFGSVLLALPVLGLLMPSHLPQVLLLTGLPLSGAMAVRERHAIDWRAVGWLFVGRFPGLIIGLALVLLASARILQLLFGLLTVVACGLLVLKGPDASQAISARAKVAAGFVSGVMDSAAGIGGPPLALLYAGQAGTVLRATLAVVFVVGNCVSLSGLIAAGRVGSADAVVAGALSVPTVVGLILSGNVARRIDADRLRVAVIAVSAVSGLILVMQALPS
jgi:uncharacterized membrane protein YfcA